MVGMSFKNTTLFKFFESYSKCFTTKASQCLFKFHISHRICSAT